MAGPVLVDSTVLIRLVTGRQGAEFAVNLFSRAEEGTETLIIPSTALYEALAALTAAALSQETGEADLKVVAEKLASNSDEAREARAKAEKLAAYIARLARTGVVVTYNVTLQDVAEAAERAAKDNICLRDALTLTVAEKLRIPKIATFSPALRQVKGHAILPP